MSRILDKVIAFLNPKPSPDFQDRMTEARRKAVNESRAAIHATRQMKRLDIESMYDRLVIDRPENKKNGGA